jgi:hypothetical protein
VNITGGSGISDDMEGGPGNWTHTGIRDAWHLSTYRSNSPSSSWYCGTDASHQYGLETDMRLMSPYFTVADGAELSFYQWYITEATYDFCIIEVNNGSPFWYPIATLDGSHGTWQQATYSLAGLAGQTPRHGFRFVSDGSVNYEGWYIDDLLVTPYVAAIGEVLAPTPTTRLAVRAALRGGRSAIEYCVPAGSRASLGVFDATGRLVRQLGTGLTGGGRLEWNLTDDEGRTVGAGAYIVRLAAGAGSEAAAKLVLAR